MTPLTNLRSFPIPYIIVQISLHSPFPPPSPDRGSLATPIPPGPFLGAFFFKIRDQTSNILVVRSFRPIGQLDNVSTVSRELSRFPPPDSSCLKNCSVWR